MGKEIKKLLDVIFTEATQTALQYCNNIIFNEKFIDELFKSYDFLEPLEYLDMSNYFLDKDNGIPENKIEAYKVDMLIALNKLKEFGLKDINIVNSDDGDEYEGKSCIKLIKLDGLDIIAGFEYDYYSYGETEFSGNVYFYEPYEVVVTKYKKTIYES